MPIYRVKGGYKIENTPGVSESYADALKRLRAIEASKHARGK